MLCVRCGYCCTHMDVIVIHPNYIKLIKSIDDIKEHYLMHKKYREQCPYHRYDKNIDKYSCAIHHKDWFPETPCGMHNNYEPPLNEICRMAKNIQLAYGTNSEFYKSVKFIYDPTKEYLDVE